MEIVETSVFTKQITQFLSDEEYRAFQLDLIRRPDLGPIIQGSGGLRKIRWGYQGHGKSGSLRIIYYWLVGEKMILLLLAYPKNVQENLTKHQLTILRKIVESELNHGREII